MEIDSMSINLRMEAAHVRELFAIRWVCEGGLVENIGQVVEEFRRSRGLLVGTGQTTSSLLSPDANVQQVHAELLYFGRTHPQSRSFRLGELCPPPQLSGPHHCTRHRSTRRAEGNIYFSDPNSIKVAYIHL